MAHKGLDTTAGVQTPELGSLVPTARERPGTIGGEGDGQDPVRVPSQRLELLHIHGACLVARDAPERIGAV